MSQLVDLDMSVLLKALSRALSLVVLTSTLLMFEEEALLAQHRTTTDKTVQPEHKNDSDSLRIAREVRKLSDSVLAIQKKIVDSVAFEVERSGIRSRMAISAFGDSLSLAVKDSINAGRQDSLQAMTILLASNIAQYAETQLNNLRSVYRDIERALASPARKPWDDVTDARDTLLTLGESFTDSLLEWRNDTEEMVQDSLAALKDSLLEYASLLWDNQEAENDAEQYRLDSLANEEAIASRLILGCGYTNRITYRGYDGGQALAAAYPSVKYKSRYGVFATVTGYNVIDTGKWDEWEIGGGYEHEFSERLSGSLSYMHFSFRESSTQIKASVTNEISVGINIDASLLNIGGAAGLAFGKSAPDIMLSLGVSRFFEFTDERASLRVWIEPSFTGLFGTQNLVTRGVRGERAKGRARAVFGVVAYELNVPLTVRLGTIEILPSFALAIPRSQSATLDSKPFGIVSIGVYVTVR